MKRWGYFTAGLALLGTGLTGCSPTEENSEADTIELSSCATEDIALNESSGIEVEASIAGLSENLSCVVAESNFTHLISSANYKDAFQIQCAPNGTNATPYLSFWIEEARAGVPFEATFPYGTAATTSLKYETDSGILEQDSFEFAEGHTEYLRGILYKKEDVGTDIHVTGCLEGSFLHDGTRAQGTIKIRFGFAVQRFGDEQ